MNKYTKILVIFSIMVLIISTFSFGLSNDNNIEYSEYNNKMIKIIKHINLIEIDIIKYYNEHKRMCEVPQYINLLKDD